MKFERCGQGEFSKNILLAALWGNNLGLCCFNFDHSLKNNKQFYESAVVNQWSSWNIRHSTVYSFKQLEVMTFQLYIFIYSLSSRASKASISPQIPHTTPTPSPIISLPSHPAQQFCPFLPWLFPPAEYQLPNKQPDSSFILPLASSAHTHPPTHTPIISSVLHPITMKVTEQASWQTATFRVTAATVSGQRWIWMNRVVCWWWMGTSGEGQNMGWKAGDIWCYMDPQPSISQPVSHNLSVCLSPLPYRIWLENCECTDGQNMSYVWGHNGNVILGKAWDLI